MIEHYKKKIENPGWTEEIELCQRLVRAINRMTPKPKFFVVCGDLLDAYPGKEKSPMSTRATVSCRIGLNVTTSVFVDRFPERRALQEKDFKKVLADLDPEIPLVCVCGNHDVGETPTQETVTKYRASFGDDYFSFWCGGVFYITINTQYYWDGSEVMAYCLSYQNISLTAE